MFFYVPTAISSNGKEFLHLRESSSRVFLRSNSHFKPLQGFSSPSRVIFSTLQLFLHPRESFSRVFLRSKSHFKQRQGISSPSRVIFTCFSTFQQPFQATSRICFTVESHLYVFFYVPTAGTQSPQMPPCPQVLP